MAEGGYLMGDDRQPDWAAAVAKLMATEPIAVPPTTHGLFEGDDALSKAIAAAAGQHDAAIAAGLREVNAGLDSTMNHLQRALASRLDLD